MPEASIIITTHNRPRRLVRAIESARSASRRETEVLVMDDASTDETAEVCRGIQDIKYVRIDRNQGVAGARNLGILASRGDCLCFLDDDDVRLPGSLDDQLEALAAFPDAGFIYGQAIMGRQDGAPTEEFYPAHCPQGDVFWNLMAQNFVPCGAAVFRRSCLFQVGLLDESLPGVDDWDLWVRLAERFPVLAQEKPVMVWRKSTPFSRQGTSRAIEMVKLGTRQFRRRWLSLPRALETPLPKRREVSRAFSNNMASHLIWESLRALAAGRLLQAQRNLFAALKFHPTGVARVAVRPSSFRSLLMNAPGEWEAMRAGAHPLSESGGRNG